MVSGRHRTSIRDPRLERKLVMDEYIALAMREGSGWVESGGDAYIVGSGLYVDEDQ